MAKLQFTSGKLEGTAVDLKEAKQLVGNRRTAEIAIRDAWISWDHAAITFEGGAFVIEDLGSKSGTFINGAKITKQALKDGDEVAFGESKAKFLAAGGAPAAAPAPAAAAPAAKPAEAPKAEAAPAAAAAPAPAPAAAAPAAKPAEDLASVKDKLARAEIDLRNAVRDMKTKDKELTAAKSEIEKLKSGGAASDLEAKVKALETSLAEKNAELEAAVKASQAAADDPMGAMGGVVAAPGVDAEAMQALRDELTAAQTESKQAKVELATATKALERKESEIERLNGKLAEASGGGVSFGGAEQEAEELRKALEEKNTELDRLNAEALATQEEMEKLQNRLGDYREKEKAKKADENRELEALRDQVGMYLEQKAGAEKALADFRKEYQEFEERVIELQAQVDDLREKNEVMEYKLEQADAKTGELVRGKLADMQAKYDEIVQANQQLKSLVEAYEEKIDELDEHVEELEAENAEMEKLLEEEQKAHEATKSESEKTIRALKKRVQAMDDAGGNAKGAKQLEGTAAE
jgi:chromosome segregation ATPase